MAGRTIWTDENKTGEILIAIEAIWTENPDTCLFVYCFQNADSVLKIIRNVERNLANEERCFKSCDSLRYHDDCVVKYFERFFILMQGT